MYSNWLDTSSLNGRVKQKKDNISWDSQVSNITELYQIKTKCIQIWWDANLIYIYGMYQTWSDVIESW